MRCLSSVLFGSVILATIVSTGACTVSAQTKDRFTESNFVITDTQAWAGESIDIELQGVPIASDGGVTVVADPNLVNGEITANARLLARAATDDKASADLSIGEVKNTFQITHGTGVINIACGHGSTHGTSDGGESGCELVEIHIPIGSATQPISVKTDSGNGKMTLQLQPAFIGAITGTAAGAGGDVEVTVPDTLGGSVNLFSDEGGDILAHLPSAFTADSVALVCDTDKVSVGPFTDVSQTVQARGTTGTGLTSLHLESKSFAGESGTIALASY